MKNWTKGDRVVQPKFRNIVANRLCPVETPLVDQHREARGRERLGDRANCKLGLSCRRQSSFYVALTVGFEKDGPGTFPSAIASAATASSSGVRAARAVSFTARWMDIPNSREILR